MSPPLSISEVEDQILNGWFYSQNQQPLYLVRMSEEKPRKFKMTRGYTKSGRRHIHIWHYVWDDVRRCTRRRCNRVEYFYFCSRKWWKDAPCDKPTVMRAQRDLLQYLPDGRCLNLRVESDRVKYLKFLRSNQCTKPLPAN